MKKIIRLTESDLVRIVKRVINEENSIPESFMDFFSKKKSSNTEKEEENNDFPEHVEGDLDLQGSLTSNLGKLESVEGDLILFDSKKLKSLGNLKHVGGNLDLRRSKVESLGLLDSVGGDLDLEYSKVESLGILQSVDGDLYAGSSELRSLGNLQYVGGNLYLNSTPLASFSRNRHFDPESSEIKKQIEKEIRKRVQVDGDIKF